MNDKLKVTGPEELGVDDEGIETICQLSNGSGHLIPTPWNHGMEREVCLIGLELFVMRKSLNSKIVNNLDVTFCLQRRVFRLIYCLNEVLKC